MRDIQKLLLVAFGEAEAEKVRQNPSVHYLFALFAHLLLVPFDPYQYRRHLRFLYQLRMYQMVIQEVAPGGGVIDEFE